MGQSLEGAGALGLGWIGWLLAIYTIGLGVYGLVTGKAIGEWFQKYDRYQEPLTFWFRTILCFGLGLWVAISELMVVLAKGA